jgi:hypothetical protein
LLVGQTQRMPNLCDVRSKQICCMRLRNI